MQLHTVQIFFQNQINAHHGGHQVCTILKGNILLIAKNHSNLKNDMLYLTINNKSNRLMMVLLWCCYY